MQIPVTQIMHATPVKKEASQAGFTLPIKRRRFTPPALFDVNDFITYRSQVKRRFREYSDFLPLLKVTDVSTDALKQEFKQKHSLNNSAGLENTAVSAAIPPHLLQRKQGASSLKTSSVMDTDIPYNREEVVRINFTGKEIDSRLPLKVAAEQVGDEPRVKSARHRARVKVERVIADHLLRNPRVVVEKSMRKEGFILQEKQFFQSVLNEISPPVSLDKVYKVALSEVTRPDSLFRDNKAMLPLKRGSVAADSHGFRRTSATPFIKQHFEAQTGLVSDSNGRISAGAEKRKLPIGFQSHVNIAPKAQVEVSAARDPDLGFKVPARANQQSFQSSGLPSTARSRITEQIISSETTQDRGDLPEARRVALEHLYGSGANAAPTSVLPPTFLQNRFDGSNTSRMPVSNDMMHPRGLLPRRTQHSHLLGQFGQRQEYLQGQQFSEANRKNLQSNMHRNNHTSYGAGSMLPGVPNEQRSAEEIFNLLSPEQQHYFLQTLARTKPNRNHE